MIAAPITGDTGPLGVIEVYAKRPGAFSETDAGLVCALASQAAIAITNARLIDELERSRAELARRADSEQTLREIAARVSAILEPARSSSRSSTRRPACSSRTAPGSTCTTPRSTRCAGRTPPATRCR